MPGLVELSLVDMPLVDAEDADTSSAPGEHPTPDPSPYSGEVQIVYFIYSLFSHAIFVVWLHVQGGGQVLALHQLRT